MEYVKHVIFCVKYKTHYNIEFLKTFSFVIFARKYFELIILKIIRKKNVKTYQSTNF